MRFLISAFILVCYSIFANGQGQIGQGQNNPTKGSNTKNQPAFRLKPETFNFDYEITLAEGVKVRVLELPKQLDEKGAVKHPSAEELKKLKGDDPAEQKLPGYKAAFKALNKGDVVEVHLSAPSSRKEGSYKPGDDPAKTVWTPAGTISGTVVQVSNKEITVRASATGVSAQKISGNHGRNNGKGKEHDTQTVIDPAQKQATVIVIDHQGKAKDEKP